MALMNDAMDLVHENSVSAIAALQSRFQQQRDFMFLISNLFDPRYAFLFFAPLVFSLDRYTGRKLMWVSVIAEWSNQVLKWVLHGERPYWWVHESQLYNRTENFQLPQIQQYSPTCETGPGSPSGHSMVSAAVWYILIEALLRQNGTLSKKHIVNRICWSVYTIILCIVSLSRIYIAAHFPHQCLLGMVIGIAVGMLVSSIEITNTCSRKGYIWGTIGLVGSALTTYSILKIMGMNPMWSVDRALKWCDKIENVHLDTTPFFSMVRYSGFFLGMGFGLHSKYFKEASKVQLTTGMKIMSALLSIGASKASEFISFPKQNLHLFYAFSFCLNGLLPYIFIAVVPYLVVSLWPLKRDKTKQY